MALPLQANRKGLMDLICDVEIGSCSIGDGACESAVWEVWEGKGNRDARIGRSRLRSGL